jgi:hypothetical protein
MYFVHTVFANSGFKRTLCGSKWDTLTGITNAFHSLGIGSTARYGCCPANKYMSSPEGTGTFNEADSCTVCPAETLIVSSLISVPNDEISCEVICSITDGSKADTEPCGCGNVGCTADTGLICYSTIGGGSCRKNDVGPFGYPRPNSGNCNDVVGRKPILDKVACEAAATSLGLSDVVAAEISATNFPSGCFWSSAPDGLAYNTLTTSTASCSSNTDYCLCISAPDCLETDGTTSNAAPCLCGNIGCTIASGLHCYASENSCHNSPPCTVTDGSQANSESCGCGKEECTANTGLICYSTIGGGSCRKNDVGPYGYQRPNSGNCNDVAGRKPILDKVACEAAATSLGLSDVVAEEISSLYYPPGCYWHNNNLYYNTLTTSTQSCSTNSDYCLCISAPDCLETDGTISNTAAPCLCGNTGCTIATGLHCYASDNYCSGPSCTVTDGSIANTDPCGCGNVGCTISSGLHCYASENYCFTGPPCTVINGSIANTEPCGCGNEICTASTGLICYSTFGGGSCRTNDVGPYGYPRPNSGHCNDVAGRKPILDKVSCEAAATSLGLSVQVVGESTSNYPPGCFWRSNKLSYNTFTTSTKSCSWNSNYCLCLSAPNCLETDGTTSNTVPCLCGNTGCTIASGLHCYASDNYCSGPPCTVTDGSIANTESCSCGDIGCTIASGLICFSNTNGDGSCRKSDFGAFGYQRPNSGKCNDVNGRKSILDTASCEAAATSLGMSDVVAEEVSSTNAPPGCYMRGINLKYNTVTTSKSCSHNSNYCLCLINQATCAQITDGTAGDAFSCATDSSPKSNPETIKCGATPCAANSDATENARCCNKATCAQITDGVFGGPFSCAASTALKSDPETFYCDAMPCSPNSDAAENARCCNQATCAQITDGVSGSSFICAGSTGLKSNPDTIDCGATSCAANSDAAENGRCCDQATCAQITDGALGGEFSCVAGSSLKNNPETINCGATPCVANSNAAENNRCCDQATCAQITDGALGGSFSCSAGSILKSDLQTINCGATPCGLDVWVWVEDFSVGSTKNWRSVTSSDDGTKLAAVVESGSIWTSTNSGSSWTNRETTNSNIYTSTITSSADGTRLAAVGGNIIWTSIDSGSSWTNRKTISNLQKSITSSADGTKLAVVVTNGNIWTSTDSGSLWTEVTSIGSVKYWKAITSSDDGTKLAAVALEGIWTSTNSGSTWISVGYTKKWNFITSSGDGTKLAALDNYGGVECNIWTSSNSGVTWTENTGTGSKKTWTSITSSADGTKLAAVVDGGNIWNSINSGGTWTEDTSIGSTKRWYSITSSADGTKLIAAVKDGNIWTLEKDAAENARCCNQATCAQITDGISGDSFSCSATSVPKSSLETINCGATPCAANSDATEKDRCCNQATCAQITDGNVGGSFLCPTDTSLKNNPETINCGATPCAANSDDTEKSLCCFLVCEVGQFPSPTFPATCKTCETGYNDQLAQQSCKDCDAGSFISSDRISCSQCQQGQWQDEINQLSCKKCIAGQILKEIGQSSNTCEDCVAGLYNPYEGHPESCLPCPTADKGASECAGCDPGKYKDSTGDASDGDADCNVCSLGQFTDERDANPCKVCPKGYFTNNQNSTDDVVRRNRCQECPRGTYGNQTKQETKEECKSCEAGRYSDVEAVPKRTTDEVICKACVAGRYSKDLGNVKDSNCKNCGSGTWSSTEAATSIDACKKCDIGRYSDDVGVADQSSCKKCDIGYEQTEEGKAYW